MSEFITLNVFCYEMIFLKIVNVTAKLLDTVPREINKN